MIPVINRSENNITAKVFVTLFNCTEKPEKSLILLGLEKNSCQGFKLELFWKGFRDYAIFNSDCREKFMVEYKKIIPFVRKAVEATKLQVKDSFYSAEDENKIFNELRNTEIDVVIFTDSRIYIGEAKLKEKLGTNGRNILAHQVIRQRTMVETLKALTRDPREISSFIICDQSKQKSIIRMEQIKALGILEGRAPRVITWQELLERAKGVQGIKFLKREIDNILDVV